MRRPAHARSGFVAIEFVAAMALLFLPTLVLVASVPVWSERRHAATVLAREVARSAAATWPSSSDGGVGGVIDSVAANYGVPRGDIAASVSVAGDRGGQATARVTVLMPSLQLPLLGAAGSWHWTTTY